MRRSCYVLAVTAGALVAVAANLAVADVSREKNPPQSSAQPEAARRAALVTSWIQRARAARLAEKKGWLHLGHWRRGFFGGYQSEADGPGFFLSPRGKRDPEAELEATLRGFVQPPAGDAHPLCRFPARWLWLQRQLQIDPSQLPQLECPGLATLWDKVRAESATLIFSSYYLNNPASAFGHTLLRLNKAGNLGVGERRELLDYGVNYSADTDTTNALLYGFKGLTGLFRGTFKLIPYYYKVREYNDYESRDLWEYQLNLEPQVMALLVAHLWELGQTYFDYYYLTENCSYHLLGVLEAADPRLELLRKVPRPILPANTVKAVVATAGLVREVRYRPSLVRKFHARVAQLPRTRYAFVDRLAADPATPLPKIWSADEKARVLDAAVDLIDVRHARELLDEKSGKAAARRQRLLERRAALVVVSPELGVPIPWSEMPDLAHGSRRIGIGAGYAERGGVSQSIEFRMALHDLADPPDGYPGLSQIEFFNTKLRFRHGAGDIVVDDLALFRVLSLSPLDRFTPKFSWKIDVGAQPTVNAAGHRRLAGHAAFAAGGAVAAATDRLAAFMLVNIETLLGPKLDGIGGGPFEAGIGPTGGVRVCWSRRLVSLVSADWAWMPTQHPRSVWRASAILRAKLVDDLALSLEGRHGSLGAEAGLTLLSYF